MSNPIVPLGTWRVQPYSVVLDEIAAAGSPSAGNEFLISDAANSWTVGNASALRTAAGLVIGTDVQAQDAYLQELADLGGVGLVIRDGAGAAVARTITGTSNQVVVTNGDGAAGNPTLSTPQDIHTGATPTFAGINTTGAVTRQTVMIDNTDSPYTVASTDHVIAVDPSAGAVVINLPAITTSERELCIKRLAGSSTVTINRNGGDEIDGAASIELDTDYQGITLRASDDAAMWLVF